MKAASRSASSLALVFAAAVLLLAGVLFWEWDQGVRLEQELGSMRKIPVVTVPALKVLPEFVLPNAESGFPELLSRSLFAVNRRSAASAGKGGRSAIKKGQFVLVGVLVTPQRKAALLRDVQTNRTETVALMGVVRGLTLGEIEPARVVLRLGAESEELTLNVQTGPRGPVAQQAPVVPPAPAPAASQPASPASAASAPKPPLAPPRMDAKK